MKLSQRICAGHELLCFAHRYRQHFGHRWQNDVKTMFNDRTKQPHADSTVTHALRNGILWKRRTGAIALFILFVELLEFWMMNRELIPSRVILRNTADDKRCTYTTPLAVVCDLIPKHEMCIYARSITHNDGEHGFALPYRALSDIGYCGD